MIAGRFGSLADAPASIVLTDARVIDPATGADAVRDVAVHDGRIVDQPAAGAERVEARGLIVAPGFCDLHTHLREPGSDGETIASGARAAAHGGYTTVCAMPNTHPPLDSPAALERIASTAADAACRVRPIAAATRGRAGQGPADLAPLAAAGAVGFSDDGAAVADEDVARAVMAGLAGLGLPFVEHAEDPTLAGGGVMRAGSVATRLGLAGWTPEAELRTVERDLRLAEETGARVHFTHLSTSAAVAQIRAAKRRGLRVTCDATPHHLALTDAWIAGSRRFAWVDAGDEPTAEAAYDGSTRVNPPLPSRADALALLAGLEDGTIDAIATDHAPHPPQKKLVPFADSAPGMIGLETALSLGLAAVEAGQLKLHRLLATLTVAPAAIIGERRSLDVGETADLVVFDPAGRWRVEPGALASASSNTPLLGMELPGVVLLTIADGRVTYRA